MRVLNGCGLPFQVRGSRRVRYMGAKRTGGKAGPERVGLLFHLLGWAGLRRSSLALFYLKQLLPVLHGLAIFNEHFEDRSFGLRLDFVHDLHRLNDADDARFRDLGTFLNKGRTVRRGREVEGAHHWRLDVSDILLFCRNRWGRSRCRDSGSTGRNDRHRRTVRQEALGGQHIGRGNRTGAFTADLQFEILLLNGELGKLRTSDEVDDLLDLLNVQNWGLD